MTRLALVGDRSDAVAAHVRIPRLLELLAADSITVHADWIGSELAGQPGALDSYDGIWLLPGSPYRSEAGALAAIRHAREGGVPFLGSCGGFQHALLEFARNVAGLPAARHAENDGLAADETDGDDVLIRPLSCSLRGISDEIIVTERTLAAAVFGPGVTIERYGCSYGLAERHLVRLRQAGLVFSGHDAEGQARITELPRHPFFLATLFQPELAGGQGRSNETVHPAIRAFAAAATQHSSR